MQKKAGHYLKDLNKLGNVDYVTPIDHVIWKIWRTAKIDVEEETGSYKANVWRKGHTLYVAFIPCTNLQINGKGRLPQKNVYKWVLEAWKRLRQANFPC